MSDHLLDLNTAEAAPNRAPATDGDYDEFQRPNGTEIDHDTNHRFKLLAKEIGLTQQEAQRLVNFYADQIVRLQNQWTERHQNRGSQWQKQCRTDPELAGNGGFDHNVATAKRAVNHFGGGKLSLALAETGAGNHPEILRCFYRIGKALSEDGFIASGSKRQKKSYAETFYPDFNP